MTETTKNPIDPFADAPVKSGAPDKEPIISLSVIDDLTPEKVFSPGGYVTVMAMIDAAVDGIDFDVATETGRNNMRSVAYRISRFKSETEKKAATLVSGRTAEINSIHEVKREFLKELQSRQDTIRAPLTAFEAADKARIDGHLFAVDCIKEVYTLNGTETIENLNARREQIGELSNRDYQEYADNAKFHIVTGYVTIATAIETRKKSDADAAELDHLRKDAAARAQKDRDDEIARNAAEQARAEEAARAQREIDAANAERLKQEDMRKQAELKADQAKADAERETQRAANDAKAEQERLAADAAHKETVIQAVADAFMTEGLQWGDALLAAKAVASGRMPHISITY